jgi:hypothetical protein
VGRFLCPDGLWAKYVGWTPYQYSQNNPICRSDGNGLEDLKTGWVDEPQTQKGPALFKDYKQLCDEHPMLWEQ